ncbi:MAG: 2Fe-2S iron-sulfur cluster-binding protein [Gemmobacter sp.]|jgi:ferredoxin, 2Fe-2S|nr:2Fe-2S iron-sulfur cluster-binding protein [Gemmobacter sp.]
MKATWILPDGREIAAEVPAGRNLMEAALAANVPGVVGECGGSLSCATCHVHVAEDWFAATGTAGDFEEAMLDVSDTPRADTSRLSCQIVMAPGLDGIVLRVPQA